MNKLFPGLLILLAPVMLGGVCQVVASAAPCECSREVSESFVNPQSRGVTFPVTVAIDDPPPGAIVSVRVVDDVGDSWCPSGQQAIPHEPLAFTVYVRYTAAVETHLRAVVTDDRGTHYVSHVEPLTVLP